MKLRGVERAEIRESKIVKYLLSTTHTAGKSKAAFFMEFGFEPQRWEELDRTLRQQAMDNEIVREERTRFGTRYIIDSHCRRRTDAC
jgi:hypothetical protein